MRLISEKGFRKYFAISAACDCPSCNTARKELEPNRQIPDDAVVLVLTRKEAAELKLRLENPHESLSELRRVYPGLAWPEENILREAVRKQTLGIAPLTELRKTPKPFRTSITGVSIEQNLDGSWKLESGGHITVLSAKDWEALHKTARMMEELTPDHWPFVSFTWGAYTFPVEQLLDVPGRYNNWRKENGLEEKV